MAKNPLSLLLLLLSASVTLAQPSSKFRGAWKGADSFFQESLKTNNIAGGALVFLEKGEITGSTYYGLADVSENRKVDENTIFHWASITKTFTTVAIMQLRDRGLLSLSDPLTNYLPELRQVHNPYGSMDDITIQMVLSHSTGLRDPTWPWGGDKTWHPFEPTEWNQIVAMLPYTEVLFPPGSKYSYSNPAFIFLGRIIEIISGDDYEVYVDKNILKPLEMDRSYFDITPHHLLKYRSNNYTLTDGKTVANGLDFDTGITASNGGLNAPIADMVRYLNFLAGYSSSYQILQRSTLDELWKSQLSVGELNGVKQSIGSSFFIEEFDGLELVGHTGTQKSFYSFFYVHPESGSACLGITNTDGPFNADQLRLSLSHYVFRNLFTTFK